MKLNNFTDFLAKVIIIGFAFIVLYNVYEYLMKNSIVVKQDIYREGADGGVQVVQVSNKLGNENAQKITQMQAKLDSTHTNVQNNASKFKSINQTISTLQKKVTKLQNQIASDTKKKGTDKLNNVGK